MTSFQLIALIVFLVAAVFCLAFAAAQTAEERKNEEARKRYSNLEAKKRAQRR